VRVNPDFTSQFRSDLEFFIPQLCSFYLRGDSENADQLVNLIVMASESSFFFSHRIWFYFQSMIFNPNAPGATPQLLREQYKKSRAGVAAISEACWKVKERLYLQNS